MKLINLKKYMPDNAIAEVSYLIDENGLDWYENQHKFDVDLLKITVDSKGNIWSSSYDISMLFPLSLSVYELTSIPVDFNIDSYQFINEQLVKKNIFFEEIKERERIKKIKLAEISDEIEILSDSVILNMASRQEKEKLEILKKYRILLNRVDISDINAIFPDKP